MALTRATEDITVSCNKTFLSHSTFAMRAHVGNLSQTTELEIPVSLENCFLS